MTRRLVMLGVFVLGLAGGLGFAQTDDPRALDPLLELLVKKGVITEAEATALQAEAAAKEAPVAPAPPPTEPAAQPAPVPAAAPAAAELPAALKGLKIGTTAYLSYQDGSANDSSGAGQDYSKFVLKRGYIDVRKEITPYFSARITPDIYLDSSGNTNVRMKYLYGALHDGRARLHRQALRRVRDGAHAVARLRGEHQPLPDAGHDVHGAQRPLQLGRPRRDGGRQLRRRSCPRSTGRRVNPGQAGRWGSFAVGLYNGGGYNASEKNSNKVLEGRVSLPPAARHRPRPAGLGVRPLRQGQHRGDRDRRARPTGRCSRAWSATRARAWS